MNMAVDDEIKKRIHELVDESLPITSMYGLDNRNFVPGKTFIQYSGPTWTNEEIEAAIFTFLRGKWLSAGENVNNFERAFSAIVQKYFSIMCNSGSSANLLMMSALKSKNSYGFENIEVLTPAVCFPTTVAPIVQCGFRPKFVDIEPDNLNIDLNKLERSITPNTKVLIFAHVLGNPPDMDRVMDICKKNNIILLEDACDSLGSSWDGKPLGSFGLMSSYSFYPAHHITTGEGGMVSTDDKNLFFILKSLASWGRSCLCVGSNNLLKKGSCDRRFSNWLSPHYEGIVDHKYVYGEIGYNLKPLDLQGAIGLVQLQKLPEIKKNRKKIFEEYKKICERYAHLVKTIKEYPKADASWFGFPINVVTDKFTRNEFVSYLENREIQTRNYFSGNILFHPPYAHLGNAKDYPNACRVMERTFFIGVHPGMTCDMVGYVKDCLDTFLKQYA